MLQAQPRRGCHAVVHHQPLGGGRTLKAASTSMHVLIVCNTLLGAGQWWQVRVLAPSPGGRQEIDVLCHSTALRRHAMPCHAVARPDLAWPALPALPCC